MCASSPRVALVSGANKGIGLGLVRHLAAVQPALTVLLGSRDANRGRSAVASLREHGVDVDNRVHMLQLDVTSQSSVDSAVDMVRSEFGGLDILVNNAGIAFSGDAFGSDVFQQTAAVNYYGTRRMMLAMLPLMRAHGRVVNISSRSGRLSKFGSALRARFLEPDLSLAQLDQLMQEFADDIDSGTFRKKGWPSNTYAVSKAGCSMLTRIMARDHSHHNLLINCCCPGWVRTDMTGPKAPLTIDQGVKTPLKLCFLPDDAANGAFWYDEQPQDWL